MAAMVTTKQDEARDLSIQVLTKLLDQEAVRKLNVRLWDGSFWPDNSPRPATLVLKHPGALRAMFLPGTELALGEAYIYDDFDIQGDPEQVLDVAYSLLRTFSHMSGKLRLGLDLNRLPAHDGSRRLFSRRSPVKLSGRAHTPERDRQAVTYHYDVSNDFYALWLDRRMVYSCAYFLSPEDDLDAAQAQKMEYICRKLRLRPGQRLLDIGCGWGGLAIYAALHHGVDVTGITLSQPQADYATKRISAANLSDRCRVRVLDYRQMDQREGYDALVSVGMFEHVGAQMLPSYFQHAYTLLRKGGVFLNHGIASGDPDNPASAGSGFSQAYVFPDGELVPISTTLRVAEESKFEVRDVESLREHYALTLRSWIRRLESRHEQALKFVDEPVYRTWRLFMSGSAYGFSTGLLNIYQSLLVKPDDRGRSGLPLTRLDWYRPA